MCELTRTMNVVRLLVHRHLIKKKPYQQPRDYKRPKYARLFDGCTCPVCASKETKGCRVSFPMDSSLFLFCTECGCSAPSYNKSYYEGFVVEQRHLGREVK